MECNKENALAKAKKEYKKVLSSKVKKLFKEQGKDEIQDLQSYYEIRLYLTSDSIPSVEWRGGGAFFKISKEDCSIIEKKFYQ